MCFSVCSVWWVACRHHGRHDLQPRAHACWVFICVLGVWDLFRFVPEGISGVVECVLRFIIIMFLHVLLICYTRYELTLMTCVYPTPIVHHGRHSSKLRARASPTTTTSKSVAENLWALVRCFAVRFYFFIFLFRLIEKSRAFVPHGLHGLNFLN